MTEDDMRTKRSRFLELQFMIDEAMLTTVDLQSVLLDLKALTESMADDSPTMGTEPTWT